MLVQWNVFSIQFLLWGGGGGGGGGGVTTKKVNDIAQGRLETLGSSETSLEPGELGPGLGLLITNLSMMGLVQLKPCA